VPCSACTHQPACPTSILTLTACCSTSPPIALVKLLGLAPATTYFYTVGDGTNMSPEYSFTTLAVTLPAAGAGSLLCGSSSQTQCQCNGVYSCKAIQHALGPPCRPCPWFGVGMFRITLANHAYDPGARHSPQPESQTHRFAVHGSWVNCRPYCLAWWWDVPSSLTRMCLRPQRLTTSLSHRHVAEMRRLPRSVWLRHRLY